MTLLTLSTLTTVCAAIGACILYVHIFLEIARGR